MKEIRPFLSAFPPVFPRASDILTRCLICACIEHRIGEHIDVSSLTPISPHSPGVEREASFITLSVPAHKSPGWHFELAGRHEAREDLNHVSP